MVPHSIDLLVEFTPMEPHLRVDAYFGLLEELRALFQTDIDLVMVGAVRNPLHLPEHRAQ